MSEAPAAQAADVIYGLDDKPPLPRAIVLALQHVLTMFGATVSVPLLLGPAMKMTPEQIATLVSSVMVCSGIATLLQVTIGSRLPIIQGVSFSFLAAFFGIILSVGATPVDPVLLPEGVAAGADGALAAGDVGPLAMRYIAGGVIAGAVIEVVIGFSGLMGVLRRVITPVVIGPVIMLIGLALFAHGAPKAGQHIPTSGLTVLLIIVFSLILARRSRFFQIFPILSAIVIVYVVTFVLSRTGTYPQGHPAHIALDAVGSSAWVRIDPRELIFPWGTPIFHLGFFFACLAGFMASMIESFGDYHACAAMAGAPPPDKKQISRGIGSEGLGCLATGLLGGFSSTSYSENVGLVGMTRVASRHVVVIGALILVALGILAKFGAFVSTIPGPLVGGLYCALFGLISAVGIQQAAKADLGSQRNLFIMGFSLFMGLSVPAAFGAKAAAAALQPGESLAMYPPTLEWLLDPKGPLGANVAGIVAAIGKSGMAVAAIVGLVLDNLIPGTAQERGVIGEPEASA